MNAYLRKLGVPKNWSITDVLSVEEDQLHLVQKPASAFILLFPLSEKVSPFYVLLVGQIRSRNCDSNSSLFLCIRTQYEQHRIAQEEKLKANTPVYPSDLFYMKQTINNACGTCALIHVVCNNKQLSSYSMRHTL